MRPLFFFLVALILVDQKSIIPPGTEPDSPGCLDASRGLGTLVRSTHILFGRRIRAGRGLPPPAG
jgi:hypothetical protein